MELERKSSKNKKNTNNTIHGKEDSDLDDEDDKEQKWEDIKDEIGQRINEESPHVPSPISPYDIPYDPEEQERWERRRRGEEDEPKRGWEEVDYSIQEKATGSPKKLKKRPK